MSQSGPFVTLLGMVTVRIEKDTSLVWWNGIDLSRYVESITIDTPPTGENCVFDIHKDGETIYQGDAMPRFTPIDLTVITAKALDELKAESEERRAEVARLKGELEREKKGRELRAEVDRFLDLFVIDYVNSKADIVDTTSWDDQWRQLADTGRRTITLEGYVR